MTSKEKTDLICKILSDKKANGIVYLDVEKKTSLCDFFIIAGGRSKTHVQSLAENLEEKLKKEYDTVPQRVEGVQGGRWVVLDYSDVIVHLFGAEERDFYCLERLWEDGANLIKYED